MLFISGKLSAFVILWTYVLLKNAGMRGIHLYAIGIHIYCVLVCVLEWHLEYTHLKFDDLLARKILEFLNFSMKLLWCFRFHLNLNIILTFHFSVSWPDSELTECSPLPYLEHVAINSLISFTESTVALFLMNTEMQRLNKFIVYCYDKSIHLPFSIASCAKQMSLIACLKASFI